MTTIDELEAKVDWLETKNSVLESENEKLRKERDEWKESARQVAQAHHRIIERLERENAELREMAKEKAVPTTYVQMPRCTCNDAKHGVVGCANPSGHYRDSTLCEICVLIHNAPLFLDLEHGVVHG